jgi:diguanylate cyclase
VEALIRWRHPERGLLTPGSFIGAAEENGLIVQIGRWVMHVACAQYRVWLDQGLLPECAAINLSPRQFRDRDLIETVAKALASNDLPPQHLEVELTENFLLENTHERINTLSELKALGIRVSLDDFGTGYSSLRYLKVLPLDRLKIDQSFVGGLTTASKDDAIVSTIIRLARSLGLDVLAEGVETEAQRSFLGDHGCEAIQGYLISPPLNVDAMTEWLSDERLSCMAAA